MLVSPYITNESKDEMNMVFTLISLRTAQHGTKNVKTSTGTKEQHEPRRNSGVTLEK
jgi:hypothetical protein